MLQLCDNSLFAMIENKPHICAGLIHLLHTFLYYITDTDDCYEIWHWEFETSVQYFNKIASQFEITNTRNLVRNLDWVLHPGLLWPVPQLYFQIPLLPLLQPNARLPPRQSPTSYQPEVLIWYFHPARSSIYLSRVKTSHSPYPLSPPHTSDNLSNIVWGLHLVPQPNLTSTACATTNL